MPKLSPADVPEVKLDTLAAHIEASLSREQRRGQEQARRDEYVR